MMGQCWREKKQTENKQTNNKKKNPTTKHANLGLSVWEKTIYKYD